MTYALIKPALVPKLAKSKVQILVNPSAFTLETALYNVTTTGVCAVDTETNGTQAADPNVYPVGIGLSNKHYTVYIDLPSQSPKNLEIIKEFLSWNGVDFIGHNVFFDGAILQAQTGFWSNWKADTYGMFRQLASEGWIGQRYGLKEAQVTLLGWESKGDVELDEWLVANSCVKNHEVYAAWSLEDRLQAFREGKCKVDKGQMYKAPPDVLGYYCGLDAYSTYCLYADVLCSAVAGLPEAFRDNYWKYHEIHMVEVRLLVQQQLRGIQIDINQLDVAEAGLVLDIEKLTEQFYQHPSVISHIGIWNNNKLLELQKKEPNKYKKLPVLGQEPARLTKTGTISRSWQAWERKRQKLVELGPGELNRNWQRWDDQFQQARLEQHFNLGSGLQRRWLFYDQMKFPVRITTKSGLGATDKKALPGFGEVGRNLNLLDKKTKLLGFISSLRERLIGDVLHPQFNVPGTYTGRLGGSGKFNLQNIPKSAAFTKAFVARPGHVWVDLDFASLEQYVLAELSRDPTLLKLYGPGALAQDVYLFNGSQLPVIGPKIRAAGYNPDMPTQEGIDTAKKLVKRERQVSKIITLASSYGAGAKKIQATLELEDIHISMPEAYQLHQGYWRLYGKVKEYEAYLEEEWERRGGWVLNGIGRPICCYVDKRKDLVNRVVQSTGHDLLMYYIAIIYQLCQDANIPAYPVFLDTHDATTWEVPEQFGRQLKLIFEDALVMLNEQMMGETGLIKLAGEAVIVRNLAEAKGLKDET